MLEARVSTLADLDLDLFLPEELAERSMDLLGVSGILSVVLHNLSNIPASVDLVSSSLLVWMVVTVSEMVVSRSDISRELTITCLQTDLHIKSLKQPKQGITSYLSSMIKKLLRQAPFSLLSLN